MARPNDIVSNFRGWLRGLNSRNRSFSLLDTELQSMSNVVIGLRGELIPRSGISAYESSAFPGTTVNGLFRYLQSNGNKELVAFSNGVVYKDSGAGTFTAKKTLAGSADGFMRFAQWRDSVFFLTDASSIELYHRGASPETRTSSIASVVAQYVNSDIVLGGDLDQPFTYSYRFTLEYKMSDDLVSESLPNMITGSAFHQESQTTTSTDKNIQIKKGPNLSLPPHATKIKIYRTEAITTTPLTIRKDTPFWQIGEITRTIFDAANDGDVLFTDNGTDILDFENQINYDGMDKPPSCRFGVAHKNRMWLARTTTDPFYLYFSEYLQPEKFRATSFIPIGYNEGEGITGLASWRNKRLVVFKTNSTWVVSGGDIETALGVPDVFVEQISDSIGCVAPATISSADGTLIWLSNNAEVYFYDGTVPKPLGSEQIKPTLENIKASEKYNACGAYFGLLREYWLAVAPAAGGGNTIVLRYSFLTRSWSKHTYRDTSQDVPYNFFVELRDNAETPTLVGGTNLDPTGSSFHKMNDDTDDLPDGTAIAWNGQTGHSDFGRPDVVKEYTAIIVKHRTSVTLTVNYDVDDGVQTSSYTIAAQSPVRQSVHVKELQGVCGHRISVKVSGSSTTSDEEVQGVSIKWKPSASIRRRGV